ncbi:MAG: tRNA adenosine(34) deaminase TadA [Agarilytica sp.]
MVLSRHQEDERWMSHALSLAQKAFDLGEVPVGAVIVSDGAIIGEGWNSPISSNDPTAHAELVAIRAACKHVENYRLVDARLYVTIEPCTMCLGGLIHARIGQLIFGACEPKSGVVQSHQHLVSSDIYNHQFECQGGILEDECSEIIQRFFKQRRDEKKKAKRE